MSIDETRLRELMGQLEADWIERTRAHQDKEKLSEAICAYANDFPNHKHPGYVLIGVDDETGAAVGKRFGDDVLQNLGALRSAGNIQPIPAITVSHLSLSDGSGDVVVIEVHPSDMPPVRYKGQVWIRVGPRRAVASEQEERMLTERRVANARTFDMRPCLDAAFDELAPELFYTYRARAIAPEIIEENHRSLKHQMASLRIFDLRRECPTNAGILLFGKDPRFWIPGAYVQFLLIRGPDLAGEIAQDKEISGDLLTVLRELDMLVDVQVQSRPVAETTLREQTVIDYPKAALRELLMNAVMHRDYESNAPVRFYWFEDRIEIQNPGGLYGAAQHDFRQQNDYRNPVIAEAMKILGYVNRYGRGVIRAEQELLKNGNPKPEFDFSNPSHAVVTVWRAP
jgi:ATP-dependent DNA helicase RecG